MFSSRRSGWVVKVCCSQSKTPAFFSGDDDSISAMGSMCFSTKAENNDGQDNTDVVWSEAAASSATMAIAMEIQAIVWTFKTCLLKASQVSESTKLSSDHLTLTFFLFEY